MGSHARQSGIDPYPEFVHREDFSVDEDPHWFVAHMSKATVKIPQEMEKALECAPHERLAGNRRGASPRR